MVNCESLSAVNCKIHLAFLRLRDKITLEIKLVNLFGGNNMAYKISSECVSCGACVADCPVDAISEGSDQYEISDACIDCGVCVDSCPVDAISA